MYVYVMWVRCGVVLHVFWSCACGVFGHVSACREGVCGFHLRSESIAPNIAFVSDDVCFPFVRCELLTQVLRGVFG